MRESVNHGSQTPACGRGLAASGDIWTRNTTIRGSAVRVVDNQAGR